MKAAMVAIGAMLLTTMPQIAASAAEDDAEDVVILSVQPRSPDVKPIMQTAPTAGPAERAAAQPTDPAVDSRLASAKPQRPAKAAERS